MAPPFSSRAELILAALDIAAAVSREGIRDCGICRDRAATDRDGRICDDHAVDAAKADAFTAEAAAIRKYGAVGWLAPFSPELTRFLNLTVGAADHSLLGRLRFLLAWAENDMQPDVAELDDAGGVWRLHTQTHTLAEVRASADADWPPEVRFIGLTPA